MIGQDLVLMDLVDFGADFSLYICVFTQYYSVLHSISYELMRTSFGRTYASLINNI